MHRSAKWLVRRLGLGAVLAMPVMPSLAGDAPLVPVGVPLDRSDAAAHDGFGTAICSAVDGVLVGCRGADGPTPNEGAVHFFRDLGDGLVQVQKITPSDPELRAEYGHAVAASGSMAVVGVPLAAGGGAVSVLNYSGGSWRQLALLRSVAQTSSETDGFGDSVAIRSDGLVAVGVPGAVVNGSVSAGRVELFEPSGGDWIWSATITASDPVGNDRFGASVAFVGDQLIVGVPFDDTAGPDAGAVIRHRKLPVLGWLAVQTVTPVVGESLSYFGRRLAAEGDRVVVGAPRLDAAMPDAGGAVVLQLVGDDLVEEAVILPESPRAYDDFGDAVAIAGDRVVIGAPADPTAGVFTGSVFIADLADGRAAPLMKVVPFGGSYAFFGTAVGVTGRWVLGGAPLASPDGQFSGAVYAVDAVTDCDGSGTPDSVEIWTDPGSDADGNGVLDACECPADLFVDGQVNGADLGVFLAYFGACGPGTGNPNCIADLNGNGLVDGADLGQILASWGACP